MKTHRNKGETQQEKNSQNNTSDNKRRITSQITRGEEDKKLIRIGREKMKDRDGENLEGEVKKQ